MPISKYLDISDTGQIPHNRSEISGSVQLLFCEGATTLAEARAKGFQDMGVFLGVEIKTEDKSIEVKKAKEGKVFTAYRLGGEVTIGLELTTKELADMRKARYLLLGADKPAFTQAALAAVATCTIGDFANVPGEAGRDYQILDAAGNPVRSITTLLIDGMVEGQDFIVQKQTGLVRFTEAASIPAEALDCTVTAAAITTESEEYMESLEAMQVPRRKGFAQILVWDNDQGSNLVMEFEPRLVEIASTGGFKVDAENVAEAKLTVNFSSTEGIVRVRS
jgi:hypothetical protein